MEHEFDAYSGSLSDFDVHGNLLAACGFSSRGLNGLSCDRFLMVYDLRMMRAVTPLQVHVDPLFLRFIPTYTSRLAIISQTGMSRGAWACFHAAWLWHWHFNLGIEDLKNLSASPFFRSVPVLRAHRSRQHGRYLSRQHSGPVAHELRCVCQQTSFGLRGFWRMRSSLVGRPGGFV